MVALVAALMLGLLGSAHDSEASTFRPNYGAVTLSSSAASAAANSSSDYVIPAPGANFAGTFAFTSSAFTVSDVPLGQHVGFLTSAATLGLINSGCSTTTLVPFSFIDASTDNSAGNLAAPAGPADNRLSNYLQDDGDINNDTIVDNAARAGNGIPDGAEWYPTGANTAAGGIAPAHRYYSQTTVPGTALQVTLQFVLFTPGGLSVLPNGEFLAVGQGTPNFTLLNDPYAPPSNSTISDFCTGLTTTTTLCGTSDTTGGTGTNPFIMDLELDCDGGGTTRQTNPAVPGTYSFRTITISARDTDGDGHENALDPCPLTVEVPAWDPRTTNALSGSDSTNGTDGIPNSCDNNADGDDDNDNDGWQNRLDICPLVANGGAPTNVGGGTNQQDADTLGAGFAPDGGSRTDSVGSECEASAAADTIANGHYHYSWIIYRVCLGGAADADADGVCDADDPNDASNDSDGDGKVDRSDNCIGRANAEPAGLAQISPDFNGNGSVQVDDVTSVASGFGKLIEQAGYDAYLEGGTQNGNIAIDDVTAGAGAFGATC
jgi:hypothetical protein